MEKLRFAIAACALSTVLHGQNLVPNPSFEEYVNCPNEYGESDELTNWFTAIVNPDYFNVCDGPNDTCGVPSNFSGFQYPATGNGYIGMITYSNDPPYGFRELIGVRLTTPTVAGTNYYVSFKVSCTNGFPDLNNWTRYAANKLGIRIRQDSIVGAGWFPPDNVAQFASDSIVTDSAGWTLLSGSFVAQENAEWFYMGNFFDNASVSTIVVDPLCPDEYSYYFFDDVCLSMNPGECPMATATGETLDNIIPRAWVTPSAALIAISALSPGRLYQYQLVNTLGKLIAEGVVSAGDGIPLPTTDHLVVLRLWDGSEEWRFKLPVLKPNP